MNPPPYLKRIIAARAAGHIPAGVPVRVRIKHDTSCPGIDRPGSCRCSPDIEVELRNAVLVLGLAGEVVARRRRR
jgi:hypothetical protein